MERHLIPRDEIEALNLKLSGALRTNGDTFVKTSGHESKADNLVTGEGISTVITVCRSPSPVATGLNNKIAITDLVHQYL